MRSGADLRAEAAPRRLRRRPPLGHGLAAPRRDRAVPHRRHDHRRRAAVKRIVEAGERADALIALARQKVVRGQDPHHHVVGRAKRGQRDGERLAGRIVDDPLRKIGFAAEGFGERDDKPGRVTRDGRQFDVVERSGVRGRKACGGRPSCMRCAARKISTRWSGRANRNRSAASAGPAGARASLPQRDGLPPRRGFEPGEGDGPAPKNSSSAKALRASATSTSAASWNVSRFASAGLRGLRVATARASRGPRATASLSSWSE